MKFEYNSVGAIQESPAELYGKAVGSDAHMFRRNPRKTMLYYTD